MLIKKYNNFINESFPSRVSTQYKISYENTFPIDYGITEYNINHDLSLDCYQDVIFQRKDLKKIPFKFNIIKGDFNIYANNITSLENCPREVYGKFSCGGNNLKDLEGCPIYVKNDFNCQSNIFTRNDNLEEMMFLDIYPVSIIEGSRIYLNISHGSIGTEMEELFQNVLQLIKINKELFEPLVHDKIKFHQMIMRLNPRYIEYYKNIPPPNKKSNLLI